VKRPKHRVPLKRLGDFAYWVHRRLPGRLWRSALLWQAGSRIAGWQDWFVEAGWSFFRRGWESQEAYGKLRGRRVAILVTDGFEQVELAEPRRVLMRAGAQTEIVAPRSGHVRGRKHRKWADSFPIDMPLEEARADAYDALLLPGGVSNSDALRKDALALRFVERFFRDGKPVAAICHGPWLLADAGLASGRTVTSYSSIRGDLLNAGARWTDREVVMDSGLITSRRPRDLPAFNRAMVNEFATAGRQAQRSVTQAAVAQPE